MQPILSASLTKTSVSQRFPRKVLFGPYNEGGLGIDLLYISQGAMHLEKFQTHYGTSSMTGTLLWVSMETAILEVGVGWNLFQLTMKCTAIFLQTAGSSTYGILCKTIISSW